MNADDSFQWSLLDPIAMGIVLNKSIVSGTKYSKNGIILCGTYFLVQVPSRLGMQMYLYTFIYFHQVIEEESTQMNSQLKRMQMRGLWTAFCKKNIKIF